MAIGKKQAVSDRQPKIGPAGEARDTHAHLHESGLAAPWRAVKE